ncbi:MAG: exonuclease subunit SbcD, partial [Clostridia bacterium]|nr:exonuclease subunit SbcD [Clostridia bacterium]
MRILHTSDWHLGKNLEQINRINEQREFIHYLCQTVEEQKIDLVLLAGDIYDTYNPSAAAEELFYEAIDRLNDKGKRAVVVIAGNHDNPERLCAASPLAYKNGIILLGYPGSDAALYEMNGGNIKIANSGPGWLELSVPGREYHAVIITLPYPS